MDRYAPPFCTHRNRGADELRPACRSCGRPNAALNPKPSRAAPAPTGAALPSSRAAVRPPPKGALAPGNLRSGLCVSEPRLHTVIAVGPRPARPAPGPQLHRPPWSRPRRVGCVSSTNTPSSESLEKHARGAPGLSEKGAGATGTPGGAGTPSPQRGTLHGGGAVTQACRSVPWEARWEFPAEVVPLSGESSSAKADGPFHRHLPTPVPGRILGFHGEAQAGVGRGGRPRGAGSAYTRRCRAPAPTGSCVCEHRWRERSAHPPARPAPLPAPARLPPPRPLLPPGDSVPFLPPA